MEVTGILSASRSAAAGKNLEGYREGGLEVPRHTESPESTRKGILIVGSQGGKSKATGGWQLKGSHQRSPRFGSWEPVLPTGAC